MKIMSKIIVLVVCMLFSGFTSAAFNLAIEANPNPVRPGENINVRLTVTNTGGGTSGALILEMEVPENISSVSVGLNSSGGNCPGSACEAGELITWNLGNLPAGSGVIVSIPATVLSASSAPTDGTNITFAATLFENNSPKASDSQTVTVQSESVLTLSVDASHNSVTSGDTLIYNLTYGNREQSNAFNTILKFPIPAGTSFVSATGGGTFNSSNNEVLWQLGTLHGLHGGMQEVTLAVNSLSDGSILKINVAILEAEVKLINEQTRATSVVRVEDDAPLSLALAANPDPALPGELLQAKLTVTNQGSSTLFDVILTLRVPDHVFSITEGIDLSGGVCPGSGCEVGELITWNLGNLPVGAGVNVSVPAQVRSGASSPLGGTLIQFSAEASAGIGFSASAEHTVIVESIPALTLSVNASDNSVASGDTLTYSLSYGNREQASALNSVLRFPLPAGTSFVSATGGGILNVAENEVLWTLGTLPGLHGGRQEVELVVGSLSDATLLKVDAATINAEVDQINEQARATSVARVEEDAPLALALAVSPDPALPGELLQAKLTVTNQGSSTLFDVILTFRVPSHLFSITEGIDSSGGICTGSACEMGELITWNLGSLPAGAGVVVLVPAQVRSGSSSPFGGTLIQFSASASAGIGLSASAEQTVIIESMPALTLSVNASHNSVTSGDTLTYSLNYGNREQASALNSVLRFPLPEGASFVSATGGGVLNDAEDEVLWTLGTLPGFHGGRQEVDLVVGNLSDGALLRIDVATFNADINLVNEQARATSIARVEEDAPLALALSISPDPALPGELLQAELTVTNQGATSLFDVMLTFRVPGHLFSITEGIDSSGGVCSGSACEMGELITWDLGNLPAGAGVVLLVPAQVRSGSNSPLGGTLIQFSAAASAGIGFSASAEQTVIVESIPALTLSVDASHNTVSSGDSLTYSLIYGNREQESALNPILRFPLPEGASFVSATGGGVLNDAQDEILWTLGTLPGFHGGRQEVELVVGTLSDGALLRVDAAVFNADINLINEKARATSIARVEEDAPLALALAVNPDPVLPGELMLAKLMVSNQGTSALFNVTLSMRVPGDIFSIAEGVNLSGGVCTGSACEVGELITWDLGNLPAGAGVVVSVPAEVRTGSSSPLGGSLIQFSAEASAGIGVSAFTERTVIVESIQALTLSVDASDNSVTIGDTLTYSLTYGNREQASALDATLRFPLPEGTSFVSATGGGILTNSEDEVLWNLGSILGLFGGRQEVVLMVGDLFNGSFLKVDAAILNAKVDQINEQARATSVKQVEEDAPFALMVTVNPNPVIPGELLLTELTVTNQSESTLFDVILTLRVPDYVLGFDEDLISGGGDCPGSSCEIGELVSWNLGNLSADENGITVSVPTIIISGSEPTKDGTLIRVLGSVVSSGSQGASQTATALVNPFTDNDLDNNPDVFDQDDDNGGAPDYWEIEHGFNPFSSSDDKQDTDIDRFTNIQEWMQGTDPHKFDTDNDGIPDGDDPSPLTAECSGENVVIDTVTFKSGVVFNCDVQASIITQGAVVANAGSTVFFGAQVVRLGPGFSVQAGGDFRAVAK